MAKLFAPSLRSRLIISISLMAAIISFSAHRSRSQVQPLLPIDLTIVSAATFEETAVAPESMVAAFGTQLALSSAAAKTIPLPTTLADVKVLVKDSAGVERQAGIFFVSPGQVNFLVPAGAATGRGTVNIVKSNGDFRTGVMQVAPVAPGLFAANSNGQGAAIGFLLRVPQVGGPSYESLARFDAAQNRYVTRALDLNRRTFQAENLFLVLFGTGLRGRADLKTVSAFIGGIETPVSFVGPQGGFVGLDQINIPLTNELIRRITGRRRIDVAVKVAGDGVSNALEIEVAGLPGPVGITITGFEPARALAGETVTIKGIGFQPGLDEYYARIGGVEAKVVEATSTQLKVKVPFGAESGLITIRGRFSEAVSANNLVIRTSISGIVEDTQRRPIPGATVRTRPFTFPGQSIVAKTNAEGVFVLPDVPVDTPFYVEVDGLSVGVTPRLPRVLLNPTVIADRDNQLPRPVSLQLATGAAIKFDERNFALSDSAVAESEEINLGCSVSPGSITLDLPSNAQVYTPCEFSEPCPDRTIYVTQVENSRTPVKLPIGHFSSTMVQISPLESYFLGYGTLTVPNHDCLPANAVARLLALNPRTFGGVSGVADDIGVAPSSPVSFVEIGSANVSPDGQSIVTAPGAIAGGGIYFISVKHQIATIIGRIVEPAIDGFGNLAPLAPVRRAIVTARGQEIFTDGNGAFTLRNVPVIGPDDKTAVEITWLRPEGRVERALKTEVAVSAGQTTSIGEVILSASNVNRPPVIIASPSFTADEGKRADFNFLATDPDQGQTTQVGLSGPSFASLISRGSGGYTLRVTPGFEDAGSYTLTITATDNRNASTTQTVSLTVFNVNQLPVANSQTVATSEDVPKIITLTGSDPDRNALSYQVVTQPKHGILAGAAPDLIYTPAKDFNGSDSFTFKVNDGAADSEKPATVMITVSPVNDLPVLSVPEERKVVAGSAVNFTVSAMDVDSGDVVNLSAVDLPSGATFNQVATNATFAAQFSWTPTAQQTGVYVVVFKAADNGSPALTATRAVAITVVAQNAPSGAGMWTNTSGPGGGSAIALLAMGTKVFAGSELNGVYRSNNNGESWLRASTGLGGASIATSFAVLGNAIYVGTSNGVYRSTDNGETWIDASGNLEGFARYVRKLLANGSRLIAATFVGVFISTDGGQTWKPMSGGFPPLLRINDLVVNGSTLFAGTDGRGVYRSTDGGQNWTAVNTNLPEGLIVTSLAVSGSSVIVGTVGFGLFRTENNGQNWSPFNDQTNRLFVASLTVAGDKLVAGTSEGVYVFPVNGQIGVFPAPKLNDSFIAALAVAGSSNNQTIFAGTSRNGIYRSTDGGQTWKEVNAGFTALHVNAFAIRNTETFAATDVGVFVKNDQDQVWKPLKKGLDSFGSADFLAVAGDHLFVGLYGFGVYRLNLQASEADRIWELASRLPGPSLIRSFGVSGSSLFVSMTPRFFPQVDPISLYRSNDLGKSWTPLKGGFPETAASNFVNIGSRLLAATERGVFVSSNNGDNWTASNTGLPAETAALSFAVSGTNLFLGTSGKGLFVSANAGQSWTAVETSQTLPARTVFVSLLASGNNLLALAPVDQGFDPNSPCPNGGILIDGRCYGGLTPGGAPAGRPSTVFISTNQGRTWAPIMSGLESNSVLSLGVNGVNIFAGTNGRGVFVRQ